MPEKFYRGSSRSAFSAQWAQGSVSTSGSAPNSTTMLLVPVGSQNRIKRVQVACMLPKGSGSVKGWAGFYRGDPDTQTTVGQLSIANPQVLRPKVFLENPDHAVYFELYLEAITLDGGATLHLVCQASASAGFNWVAKWYTDASLHY